MTTTVTNQGITLTQGQEKALEAFLGFLCDPNEPVFVLKGYAGTGKSTLVQVLLDRVDGYLKAARLINASVDTLEIVLTATTNKAAEAFSQITKRHVVTIHSELGLRVHKDFETGTTRLIPRTSIPRHNLLLFIDEASYIDSELLALIMQLAQDCKIVFIGDPAQLSPVKSSHTPVFSAPFKQAMLDEVVRQAKGSPIMDLSTSFRETVTSGKFFSFTPDGHHIQRLSRDDFEAAALAEFSRPDWKHTDSKILAWTNQRVIHYNKALNDYIKGTPDLQVGDYAVCNSYVSSGSHGVKADQLVHITRVQDHASHCEVPGKYYEIDYRSAFFCPDSLADKKARINLAKVRDEPHVLAQINNNWIDLRAAYACTINKSQGSTYNKVFIDLDDIRRCNSGNLIARMMYVAVSRARHQVFLTGDLA